MESLIRHMESFVKPSSQLKLALEDVTLVECIPKNDYALQAGQYCNKIWFIDKGMIRKYTLHNGEEISTWISVDGEICTSLPAYMHKLPSEEYLQACEDTRLIGIHREAGKVLGKFPEFEQYVQKMMQHEFVKIDLHTRAMNLKDAKGRYDYLKSIAPEMVKRAKLGHIASILGMKQETLSRIRKQ